MVKLTGHKDLAYEVTLLAKVGEGSVWFALNISKTEQNKNI